MSYSNYKTFKTEQKEGILRVTFDYPPVNIMGNPMLDDLEALVKILEVDKDTKVVIFQSANPEFFIAYGDVEMFKEMSLEPIERDKVELSKFQKVFQRITNLPQATIAKVQGYARGAGHEFTMACDMCFAEKGKAIFMQMEVGMGILPCCGGSAKIAKIIGTKKALELFLSAEDFTAEKAENYGLINKALDRDEIDNYVDKLAERISKFSLEAIEACKKTVYKAEELSIEEAMKEETYMVQKIIKNTGAEKRFTKLIEEDAQNNIENQRNFQEVLMELQKIK